MELVQIIFDIFNGIIGLLNQLLSLLEMVLSPITNLIDRWNGLGLG